MLRRHRLFKLVFIALLLPSMFVSLIAHADSHLRLDQSLPAFTYPSGKYSALLNHYRSIGDLAELFDDAELYSENILTWQLPSGGFGVHNVERYREPWNQGEKRSVWHNNVEGGRQDLANFDDGCTVSEIRFLASVYAATHNKKLKTEIKSSIDKAIQFIFDAQHSSGSWPQVYPRRLSTTYSNLATINDDAMVRIMVLLADIRAGLAPFNSDLVQPDKIKEIDQRLVQAIESLLSAQVETNGVLTIWPAQYDPLTYLAKPARSFEPAGRSVRESVGVVVFLLNSPFVNDEVELAIQSAITWFRDNALLGVELDRQRAELKAAEGKLLWYRFYDLERDTPFFGDRDGVKKYNFKDVSLERRTGYAWAGQWAKKLLR